MSEFMSCLDRAAVFAPGTFDGPAAADAAQQSNLLNYFIMTRTAHLGDTTGHSLRKEVGSSARTTEQIPGLAIFLKNLAPEDPSLYSDAVAFLMAQPNQSIGAHWRALFDWLAARFGATAWIERSGVSIEYVGTLIDWYPDARILHLHRDGPTNALGIRAFRHFVLYASFALDPPSEAELESALSCEPGSPEDPIMRRLGADAPTVEDIGRYWSWQIARGAYDWMRIPPRQRMDVRYEDLVSQPEATLARIAEFFELPTDEGWIARAAAEIDPEGVPDRLSTLDPETLSSLTAACLPGQVLVGRALDNPFADSMIRARDVVDRRRSNGAFN